MTTLFISDLHLHESHPEVIEGFFTFIREQAQGAEALYILGDFFDVWVGDDNDSALALNVASVLKALNSAGTHIFLMHGNRDFLLGHEYARACGAHMIPEGTLINLYGQNTLLMHGDSLCTDDEGYMKFREEVRGQAWQSQFMAQPLAARRAIAQNLRDQSQNMNSMKSEDIMDVNADAVQRAMKTAYVTRLIHGHTHRPYRHPISVDGRAAERIVLGDWHDQGWCVRATPEVLELESWTL